ncbi:MAG: HAD-IIA family hydrolase [Aquificae bacterium]|nr:HAD-IIA family hydrolase [Aquificota bacterium]
MDIKGFLIDLDGVLVKDKDFSVFEDAPEFIKKLRSNYIPFKIATNNSRIPPEDIAKILKNKGLPINKEDIFSPLSLAPKVLNEEYIKSIFVIGENTLVNYLKKHGFKIQDDPKVDAVLIAQDRNLDFEKLKIATTALKRHTAKLYAMNNNLLSQDGDGLLFPGVGAISKMFVYACTCNEDYTHFGKMSDIYNRYIFQSFNFPPEKLAIISDDLYIDLAGYKKLGLKTVFLTTGKYQISDIKENFEPDFIFDSLSELLTYLEIK